MTTLKHWEQSEDQYLIDNFHNTPNCELSAYLGRTEGSIRVRANDYLKLRKDKRCEPSTWSDREIKYLTDNFGRQYSNKIAIALGRSQSGIAQKAIALGLYKPVGKGYNGKPFRECLSADNAERMERFLLMVSRVKRVADRLGKSAKIDLNGMRDAFRVAEG